jgi:arsenate reductase (glutaredoxin)
MLKIYHNPRCRKSREGLNYLKNKTTGFEIVDYLKDGLTAEMLDEIFLKSNLKPEQLVRTQEEAYKKELKGRSFTKEEWKRIFIENPKLLQRPIVVGKQKAVLAQPPENLDKLL